MGKSGNRERGTALVERDGKVLLVRDRGVSSFSLPGGKRDTKSESFMCTAVRELYEELGMRSRRAERIYPCDYESAHNLHKVTLIETDDEPTLPTGGELAEYIWWDQKTPLPCFTHVTEILRRYKLAGP